MIFLIFYFVFRIMYIKPSYPTILKLSIEFKLHCLDLESWKCGPGEGGGGRIRKCSATQRGTEFRLCTL